MRVRKEIRFLLNGEPQSIADLGPGDTLLDFLRLQKRLTGSKEGCAEGDCGACTVLVGRLEPEGLNYEPINACIRLLATVDRCHVVTVEHLTRAGQLHPVQQAMVECHASQCGFCTPGIVMALYALWMQVPSPDRAQVETALQGNLCRCTGYAPIVRAAEVACALGDRAADPLVAERSGVTAQLRALADAERVEVDAGRGRVILPATVDDLAAVLAAQPDATIVAGATDVGLWVTKELRDLGTTVFIGQLAELREVANDGAFLRLGAAVTYTEAGPVLAEHFPHLAGYWSRIGGWQVRNMGTLGGNIANGSPIGDTPPALIALGAEVVLHRGAERRRLTLEDFFLDYGKQDRAPGEFIERIEVPLPRPGQVHAAYKLSKRRDEDISTVAMGIRITVEGDRIAEARIALGGMAGIPKRAAAAEAALAGQPFAEASFTAAAAALAEDFTPLGDWRAGAGYRMLAARNLLRRFWLEQSGQTASLEGVE